MAGRPLQYKTVEELQSAVDEYFAFCDNRITQIYSKEVGDNVPISFPAPYTMSGLARAIGLSRQALSEYNHREQFGDAIKKARARVEEDIETRLLEGRSPAGAIFNLKNNFGWMDQSRQDIRVEQVTPILGAKSKDVHTDDSDEETPEA